VDVQRRDGKRIGNRVGVLFVLTINCEPPDVDARLLRITEEARVWAYHHQNRGKHVVGQRALRDWYASLTFDRIAKVAYHQNQGQLWVVDPIEPTTPPSPDPQESQVFHNNPKLQKVTIPDSVTIMGGATLRILMIFVMSFPKNLRTLGGNETPSDLYEDGDFSCIRTSGLRCGADSEGTRQLVALNSTGVPYTMNGLVEQCDGGRTHRS
jgi:hypothetical protein